jgi:hydroxyacylglutathione hydrolase
MNIRTFTLGDYQTNCFIVTGGERAGDCIIVDCGYRPRAMLDYIEQQELRPAAMLLTHCHADHIAGIDEAIARFGPPAEGIWVHEAEKDWCANPLLNLSGLSGTGDVSVTSPDRFVRGGETLRVAGIEMRVLHTPGHSPGGVCFIHDDSKQAIVGDVIFAGSIGRIDFPTSDPEAMRQSLETLMTLPDELMLHPGHGPSTTIGRERRTNPYIAGGIAL